VASSFGTVQAREDRPSPARKPSTAPAIHICKAGFGERAPQGEQVERERAEYESRGLVGFGVIDGVPC
jgi:hypothetical protein